MNWQLMTTAAPCLTELEAHDEFHARHIGPNSLEIAEMLGVIGHASLEAMTDAIVPAGIKLKTPLALPEAVSEEEALSQLCAMAAKNDIFKNFIGRGYYGTHTPKVILRNVLENPAWYTAYTPYQAEIAQGRLEALLNFQTMVADLTGMAISNASLLDEATAAAEAMTLAKRNAKNKHTTFLVSDDCHPQTVSVIQTRAEALGLNVVVGKLDEVLARDDFFGVLVQYPATNGVLHDLQSWVATTHAQGALFCVVTDLLALTLLKPPGEFGADIVVGNTQRFGVPMGFGGPHAAFLACQEALKRSMPGRLVGVSVDAQGKPAYRLALQTREQHIRREKATSNICTAQVLLAVVASMYAVYHGPQGLRRIAQRVHRLTMLLATGLERAQYSVNSTYIDTLTVRGIDAADIYARALAQRINLLWIDEQTLGISLDETTTRADVQALWRLWGVHENLEILDQELSAKVTNSIPENLRRSSDYLTHPVFNTHHSETEMLRYLRLLSDKDLALDRTMIPLGSCTMKLNATTEMLPITWPEFAHLHPFAPSEQSRGYRELIDQLQGALAECTGYDAVSLQPNSGAQGEYAGLLAIRAYHRARGEGHRDVCLIPESAHGTNPASAHLCGMRVVVVQCDAEGNVDLSDLREKAEQHAANLAALMVTYPSTHGVFEEAIVDICNIIHKHGGQVYTDGANMNALVGLAKPGQYGSDVSHLNLHKTFCIPHGGGGPGVGPVAVKSHLAPYLPGSADVGPVSAAPFGSASILPISWMYITLMGAAGLRKATQVALLNANYVAKRLQEHYPILYSGRNRLVAHECILDLRPIKASCGITAEDVAKRLMDYGFHAPTLSFPVPGTLMIEPTESESKHELDRFIEAMIAIRAEIRAAENGVMDKEDNPLKNAPHTAAMVMAKDWTHSYSREDAAFPLSSVKENKYWPPVARVDNAYGDRHVICSCLTGDWHV